VRRAAPEAPAVTGDTVQKGIIRFNAVKLDEVG
jgi:hypothetical protein